MTNGFDGTEALTYVARHGKDVPLYLLTPQCIDIDGPSVLHAGVVNLSAIPYECLAEERTIREDIMNEKVESMLDDTQLGCATEIAEALR